MGVIEILKGKLFGNFYSRFSAGDTFDLYFDGFRLISQNVVALEEHKLNSLLFTEYQPANEAIEREDIAITAVMSAKDRLETSDHSGWLFFLHHADSVAALRQVTASSGLLKTVEIEKADIQRGRPGARPRASVLLAVVWFDSPVAPELLKGNGRPLHGQCNPRNIVEQWQCPPSEEELLGLGIGLAIVESVENESNLNVIVPGWTSNRERKGSGCAAALGLEVDCFKHLF